MKESHENDNENIAIKETWYNYLLRILPLIAVVCLILSVCFVVSWPVVLQKLEKDTEHFTVTKDGVAWLVSAPYIIGIIGSTVAGYLLEVLGPKRMALLALLPFPVLWLLMAFTPYISLLYLGRIGISFISCLLLTASPSLLAELSTREQRGRISVASEVVGAVSTLTMYLFGHFLSWRYATAAISVPSILILSFFLYF